DLNGHTALMHAAVCGSALVVSTMLDFGSSPSAVSQIDSNTPLTLAAAYGQTEAYGLLVSAGASVTAMEEPEQSPWPAEQRKPRDFA
ncbi:unnamed protein product, partial [Polarella glacialis]